MPARTQITDRDWVLVALGEQSSPLGRGNQPATLRLEASTSRAVGFAGCNRFSASYTLAGDSLRFGPAMATKMGHWPASMPVEPPAITALIGRDQWRK